MTHRPTVLFVAEAVTLAHVGRAIALATALQRRGEHEVVLACDPREARFTADLPFPVLELPSVAPLAFRRALARGRAVYSFRTLERYARDDLRLIDRVRPAAVVGDFRLSLSATARHAGVPYVNITNAYWSPFARPRFALPSLPGSRHLPRALADRAFRLVRPLAFALHARPLNRLRRGFGLAALPPDVRHAYCDGDATLYADIPGMVPLADAPATHRVIGPVQWSPSGEPPGWWDAVLHGPAPIYLTLGSSGPADLLDAGVEALAPLGLPLVVATADRVAVASRPGVHVAAFVPGEAISARAALVVCNGGSPTTQQALAHGVPVLGIASNLDLFLNMHYVARFGAGKRLAADRASTRTIRAAARAVLDDPALRTGAKAAAQAAAGADPAGALAATLATLVGPAAPARVDRVR
jgi:UDP:flavonoid glycosyltransferase YjiC (YdhE family)